jgi:Domain of unknown function (DUF4340)
MNARLALVLVVLLIVLGGGALVYRSQENAQRPENVATLGRPLLKDVPAAKIATVRITEPKATLTLKQQGDGWVIIERRGFPADLAKVREFVVKLIELKVGQSEPIGEKDRARLNLDEPGKKSETAGTQVELAAADGKPLAKLIVGKKYFKREVENPDKAPADGRFVALPSEEGTVYIISDPLAQASAKSADWIDRTSFQVEKVKSLDVRLADGERWRLERAADNADWKLAGLQAGEKVDSGRANAATYSLSLLELADVAPDDAKDTGLDKPALIDASTFDGLEYSIKVGRPEGENYYVRFNASGSLPAQTSGPDAERIKKLRERAPREKLLQDYVLLIPKSKLEDTLKPRAELLEKKPDAKK